ncbi:MAG: hypothetical protein CYG61_02085, partial [Actinobacteria bacterium]
MRDSVTNYLDRLQEQLDPARARYTQANGDDAFRSVMAAEHLAKLQRLSGHALDAAVDEAHQAGMTWRAIAPHVQVPFGTLHRQWSRGLGI